MICFSAHGEHTSVYVFTHNEAATATHTHTKRRVPHGCQYDLVEQVVVQLLGHLEAGPLHGDRGGQTQDDAEAAQHAEHCQIPRVAEATLLPRQRERGGVFNSSL